MTTSKQQQIEPLNTKGADSAIKIEQLLKELIECLDIETQALKVNNRDLSVHAQQKKQRLVQQYQGIYAELSKEDNGTDLLDSTVKSYLKKVIDDFEVSLKNNSITLNAGKNAVSRILGRILDRARNTMMQENPHYNSQGKMVLKSHPGCISSTKVNETY